MARLKIKDIKNSSAEERNKKIEELKFELVKAKAGAAKGGSSKIKEIKRTIARIITLNNQDGKQEVRHSSIKDERENKKGVENK